MLNRVILIGRLTKDPDLRYTPNGIGTCNFTLAVERSFSNNGKKETDFIKIVTWKKLAETCANYLGKGRLIGLDGRLQIRNYENNEGRKVYVSEVVAESVRFLEHKDVSEAEEVGNFTDGNSKPIELSDDDLPF
ncbi:single-stranded DNA-binding protein [Chengkuizengella sp. SCS-71B]|uniref:single-stranded DNA-binding protein n=1 Tax=Chengkuizengella sp. SCS-71B TaxID=3115290 RepID=UPI0032C2108A